jgi:hypothetical protein
MAETMPRQSSFRIAGESNDGVTEETPIHPPIEVEKGDSGSRQSFIAPGIPTFFHHLHLIFQLPERQCAEQFEMILTTTPVYLILGKAVAMGFSRAHPTNISLAHGTSERM